VAQAAALSERIPVLIDVPVVVGGDFNSVHGHHDGAVVTVAKRVPLLSCGTDRTNRWPLRLDVLAPFVGRLDHMFSTMEPGRFEGGVTRWCETLRSSHGSDHLPVLLTLQY
jgi:endonuclease/exonuclease/phosphatase family metal-dependent hydrolase